MRESSRTKVGGGLAASLAGCTVAAFMVVAPATAASATPAAALAAQPSFSIQSSPNATVPGGQLKSVACSAADACTAVGSDLSTSGVTITLAERWDGKSWRVQATPNPAADTVPADSPILLGVSCPSADFCEAVGAYQVSAVGISMAQRWNGRDWTWQPFPVPAGSTSAGLDQVSCTSARFCEAVGSYSNGVGENLPFAARWNGFSWRLQGTPYPDGATLVRLNGVSCTSATFCEAVGNAVDVGEFAVRWNGNSWHLQAVPGTAGASSVSCASPTFCESVGGNGGDMWNGSAWTAQAIPGPTTSTPASFSGVSCAGTGFCQAVGQYSNSSGATLSVGATWNGESWLTQTTPNPAGAAFAILNGVACASPTVCEAGGDFQLSSSAPGLTALAESWNGSAWQTQQVIAPRGATDNALNGVSCVSAILCEAVGSQSGVSGVTIALAEVWNGTAWKIQQTPNPAVAANGVKMVLNAVSCVSAQFCEAVGSSSSSAGGGAEIWDGTSWALQAIPGGYLTSVSCATTDFCMAAGGDGHVDIWNGTSWSAEASTTGFTSLSSVWCASAEFCEATGSSTSGDEAEGWNGVTWSAQATPTPAGGSSPGLSAVSCSGPDSCEAVGSYSNSTFQPVTLAEVWNGTAWAVQPSPNPSASMGSSLRAVWCTTATSCTAAGEYSVSIPTLTLAEVWNGKAWSLRSTPDVSYAGQNSLNAVSCGASQDCTAVGGTDDLGQIPATLVETGD
jgi:hypothetical protein